MHHIFSLYSQPWSLESSGKTRKAFFTTDPRLQRPCNRWFRLRRVRVSQSSISVRASVSSQPVLMGIERQVIQLTEYQVDRFHGFSFQLLCCQTPAGRIKNLKTSRASIVIIRQPLVSQSTCPSPKCCWSSYGKLSSDRRWKSSSRLPVDRSTAMLRARTASIGAWWVTCGQKDFSSLALCLRERPWLEATATPLKSSCR